MFRFLPITLLLAFSLIGIAYANNPTPIPVIAAYSFEKIDADHKGLYVVGWGHNQAPGYLKHKASTQGIGKYGKPLFIGNGGFISYSANHPPRLNLIRCMDENTTTKPRNRYTFNTINRGWLTKWIPYFRKIT